MTTLSKIKLIALILLTASSFNLRADTISGSYSNDCTGLIKLWDLSGTYHSTNDDQTETETVVLNMSATGAITGSGHFDIIDNANSQELHADFVASGKVTSAGSVVRAKLVFVVTQGTGQVQGHDVTFTAKLNENFEVDDGSRMLVGNTTGTLKFKIPSLGLNQTKPIPSTSATENLPDGVDGGWGLFLAAAPTGTKYNGSSRLQLSNGKTFDLAVAGSYSSKTDLSKIALKSTDKSAPIALNLVEQNNNNILSILSLKGKVLGQKLQFKQ